MKILDCIKEGAEIGLGSKNDGGRAEITKVWEKTSSYVMASYNDIGAGRQGKAKFYSNGNVEEL